MSENLYYEGLRQYADQAWKNYWAELVKRAPAGNYTIRPDHEDLKKMFILGWITCASGAFNSASLPIPTGEEGDKEKSNG